MNSSHPMPRRRRRHLPEFKQGLVALCHPGASTAAVALAHGVNANLLRRWIKQYSGAQPAQTISASARLVPIQVDLPAEAPANDAIEISIQKNNARVSIRWPSHQAKACAQWLGEWLE